MLLTDSAVFGCFKLVVTLSQPHQRELRSLLFLRVISAHEGVWASSGVTIPSQTATSRKTSPDPGTQSDPVPSRKDAPPQ
ncbi:hypothetical protein CesoFtcFv8_024577 [Champsocephalus esox]|uniref:Uncharacterized protein n=1 Tax=Champsocephalus esox TaxID=159716 RepID=A0AAN8B7B0_9TELE|nr:hypothetical protein CesoFtcFv8_024577 [Champsocephalus esox]